MRMLFALTGARELSASDLAYQGRVSPQAASAHLAKLVQGGLVLSRRAGRQHLFRLAAPHVARAVESLASLAPAEPTTSLSQESAMQRLRKARSCYDHIAGELGVAITDAFLGRGVIVRRRDRFALTPAGRRLLERRGIDIATLSKARRPLVRSCMDWTEHRFHIAGSLGAALLDHVLAKDWVRRNPGDRSLQITALGAIELRNLLQE
ncbi:MAG: ArsR/SmtB family transcription factor [Candidatus Tyrphobacter sp.]